MQLASKLLTCCAAGAMLAACGGKDKNSGPNGRDVSYGGSTQAVVISEANVAEVASSANASVSGAVSSASEATSYGGTASPTEPPPVLSIVKAMRRSSAVAFTGASGTEGQPCSGGGAVTRSWSVASEGVSTIGDYIELSVADCIEGDLKMNGSMRTEVTQTDGSVDMGDPRFGPTMMTSGVTYGTRVTVDNFTFESPEISFGMDGDVEMSQVWNSSTFRFERTMQGTSLVSNAGVGTDVISSQLSGLTDGAKYSMTEVSEYSSSLASTLVATESGVNAKVCSTALNGCTRIETAELFRQIVGQLYPDSGSMKVSDDAGHYIEVVPTDGTTGAVTVSWEVGANASTPDKTCATTWSTMATDACFP